MKRWRREKNGLPQVVILGNRFLDAGLDLVKGGVVRSGQGDAIFVSRFFCLTEVNLNPRCKAINHIKVIDTYFAQTGSRHASFPQPPIIGLVFGVRVGVSVAFLTSGRPSLSRRGC